MSMPNFGRDPATQSVSVYDLAWWTEHLHARRRAGPTIRWENMFRPCGCFVPDFAVRAYAEWIKWMRYDEAVSGPAIEREEAKHGERVLQHWRAFGAVPAGAD